MQRLIVLLVIATLGWYGYGKYQSRLAKPAVDVDTQSVQPFPLMQPQSERASVARFTCDGRTYCSQMTSCEEATYFLRNCPGTKMDGNNDGVPCESQWCN